MIHRYAKFVSKYRFAIILVWIAITVVAMFTLPSLSQVVAKKATSELPNSEPVIQAGKLLDQINPTHKSKSSAVIAIHNSNGLTSAQRLYLENKLSSVLSHQATYGVVDIQDEKSAGQSAKSMFESKDGTTEIALVDFKYADDSDQIQTALNRLHTLFNAPPAGTQVYLTGDAPLSVDATTISQHGVDKTMGVTVGLVLIILLVVFQSLLAPLVTLIAIGLSFLLSSSVVAWLAAHGLPVSSFTQTFLVAVLFGAGTDYTIIMLNRYRESLSKSEDRIVRLEETLRSIGKTVIFSAITVMVSFAVLYFANFGLYRSGVGVAVGVLITLLCCVTFVPAIMDTFQTKLFWPRKIRIGQAHSTSKVWSATGGVAIRRPWWALLCLVVVLVPIALQFTDKRSFSPMDDIPSAPSVQGFNVVSASFGAGHVLPMNIVIHTDRNLRTQAGLTTIYNVSKAISAIPSVDQVESATQPTGTVISQFQLATQNGLAANGLTQVNSGLSTLKTQLSSGSHSAHGAAASTQQLVTGANGLATGVSTLNNGLLGAATSSWSLAQGAQQVATGANGLQQGTAQFSSGLNQVSKDAQSLANGIQQASSGVNQLASGSAALQAGDQQASQLTQQLADALAAWSQAHPNESTAPQWQQIEQLMQASTQAAQAASAGATQVNRGAQNLATSFPSLNEGAQQLQSATDKLATASSSLASGAKKVASGATQVATGASSLQQGINKLASGSTTLSSGSRQLADGVTQLPSALHSVANGMGQAADATSKLGQGVSSVSDALQGSQQAKTNGDAGFYIPASALHDSEVKQAMDAYISPDGHVANITVMLNENPYSEQAMNAVSTIQSAATAALQQSPIHSGTIMSAGTTPQQMTLNQVSTGDFLRTVLFILFAIFILLVVMLRSIFTPLYILASLVMTYGVTMGVLQLTSKFVLHKSGLSWSVPFFVFLLLVALGVDYSIFLFSRFQEELKLGFTPKQAMHRAMSQMGNVIFSAALIMGGTFGSMMASGVTSLIEIGLAVVVGLFLYAFVLLGFFVPALSSIVDTAHHWPFFHKQDEAVTE
ncbi:MMPL family transporter [Alicyclobacillus fastidiosus]|uniref:MMPL family transporter n=1 Tax=Alicyclobacillus fastidiosus TaxID=392011 RepID=A0ABV5AA77_9BACL|nr:MMPL family transporter [Alicyclobacillus fastidiosus]WEH10899.1 MMPL family transporter [Alicyclobacillus fastidiosus]